ncbi:MAG TPA: beta-ketoacyl synthase N-terminal-like domain-containing protein [Micromonosporaceae bacterium]|nr:beta-ketoacyl synthase N-terminal-like domain-containing protein [Micromonosporaceae bacterium]
MTETRAGRVEPGAAAQVEAAVVSGMAALSAFGRGVDPLFSAALAGQSAFQRISRFDVSARRVDVAATLPGSPVLLDELVGAVDEACDAAELSPADRAGCPLFLAVHGDPALARAPAAEKGGLGADSLAAAVTAKCGLSGSVRAYTSACVAASTAVADAAALVARGRLPRVAVAAGYLVESDQFALFDAGRAMAQDGQVRPFSAHRTGLLLGDGVAAIVVEARSAARRRGAPVLARLAGWGRAGDAYHVCQPRPDGAGLARAIGAALDRGGATPADIGYVNAHGSGTPQSDRAEAAAIHRALGGYAEGVPISSSKSVHGQALEASGLLELVITVLAVRHGRLPVNAGFLAPDSECRLDVIVDGPRTVSPEYALSLNAAFGGANTALLVGAP